ncbi:MAG: DNA-3-methyladenine glycosylase 2 family protein [Clostridia bacterium]|nr:DNA-3-methyladenine glycosylase 2 family protein [Clostridia bacterium]
MTRQSCFEFPRPGGYDVNKVFDCGQCFRFERVAENVFEGVALGAPLRVRQTDNTIIAEGFSSRGTAVSYLGLDFDYGPVKKELVSRFPDCPAMEEAIRISDGVAILRQEPWEALISFIISQNNNIPRIKGLINRLCERCGEPVGEGLYAFPTPRRLAGISEAELSEMKFGYRAGYIARVSRDVSEGSVDLEKAKALPTGELVKFLTGLHGVGPKVASCIALFGYFRLDAFPVDVWIKRALAEFFPGHCISDFGEYGGIAQQYLFYMQTHRN